MFGQKPMMPIDIEMATNYPEDQLQKCLELGEISPSRVQEITSQRLALLEQVKENFKKA